jgi:hypothetical protein
MKLLLVLFLTILTSGLEARVFRLAVITSEFDNDKTNYFLETDETNTIVSMRYVTIQPNGGIYEDVTLPAERVMEEGAVLVERNGLEAVRLEVENFNLKTGGVIKLNYLYNGVIGTRHVKKLLLTEMNGDFVLHTTDIERVNRLFLEANRNRILGIIGIKSVKSSFLSESVELQ